MIDSAVIEKMCCFIMEFLEEQYFIGGRIIIGHISFNDVADSLFTYLRAYAKELPIEEVFITSSKSTALRCVKVGKCRVEILEDHSKSVEAFREPLLRKTFRLHNLPLIQIDLFERRFEVYEASEEVGTHVKYLFTEEV